MKAEIVAHYPIDDTDFSGDYYDIELFIEGNLVKKFGDYYHDKGHVKVEAFLEGVAFASGKPIELTKTDVADRD